ncbi:MAG: hypothetical protein IT168_07555 [Bryobacterales bacterium]|nr:hypothetical protein [Bryobacterales bacterium]
MLEPQRRTFQTELECRYLIAEPDDMPGTPILTVALHGYGMKATTMLDLVRPAFGSFGVVASIEAPYQFYMGTPGESQIGYNWGTAAHWEANVRLHHEMVRRVIDECRQTYGIPATRTVLVGFSQPVSVNYRLVATYPEVAAGVVGVCGGVPRDWEDPKYSQVSAALLHIARDQDEFYPAETARGFERRLRFRSADVELHMLPGGHRYPSKASPLIAQWLERTILR